MNNPHVAEVYIAFQDICGECVQNSWDGFGALAISESVAGGERYMDGNLLMRQVPQLL